MLDASRQRARRIEADARLMEKRAGEAARETVKEDVVSSQKAAEETRARLAGEMDAKLRITFRKNDTMASDRDIFISFLNRIKPNYS